VIFRASPAAELSSENEIPSSRYWDVDLPAKTRIFAINRANDGISEG